MSSEALSSSFANAAGATVKQDAPHNGELLQRLAELEAKNRGLQERIEEQQAEIRDLRIQAFYDSLTGLRNRQGGTKDALRMITEACSGDIKLGVVMFDLDNFKAVNDILGHEAGDEALRIVAQVARANMRVARTEEDHRAIRQGGDEHVFLVNSPRDEGALHTLTERLRGKIEMALQPINQRLKIEIERRMSANQSISSPIRERYEQGNLTVSASFGAVLLDPARLKEINRVSHRDCEQPANLILLELLKLADKALYQSKQNGRNCSTILDITKSGSLPDCVRSLAAHAPEAISPPAPQSRIDHV